MGIGYVLDPTGTVVRLIKEWNPRKCRTEKDYERSLVRHLEGNLKGKEIVPQYGAGRSKGDIVVDSKILIEIKVNLNSTAKLDSLIGQIDRYQSESKKPVVVVLCGKHDRNLLKRIKESIERLSSPSFLELPLTLFETPWLNLVVK